MQFHHLDYAITPEQIFQKICGLDCPVWLDSGYPAGNHSRHDILAAQPESRLQISQTTPEAVESFYQQAEHILNQYSVQQQDSACPFMGGLIGCLGYDLFSADYGLEPQTGIDLPEAYLGLYLWAVVYDHHRQSAQLVFHPACSQTTQQAVMERLQGNAPITEPSAFQLNSRFQSSETEDDYEKAFNGIQEYILAGDVYQVNYAQHFAAQYEGDCSTAYLKQRKQHPAPFSAFIKTDRGAVLSHSPEEFIQVTGSEVQTQPIKGTAPRAKDPKMDQRNAEVLQSSIKERAENLMIVDLLRNDLGKACEPGSISVPRLFELQSFSNVHHLVSLVRGRLRKGVSALQLLRFCLPGGSITGAPKKRAMEIIRELETRPRSIYCGNIGYISLCGRCHTNIAIRTLVADGEKIHCWGGGGIVSDSNATQEYQETLFKVGPMMQSLENDFAISDDKSKLVS